MLLGFLCGSAGKESTCSAGDLSSTPGLGRSPGEGKGYPLQYSCLENSMDCMVHEITNSQTRLSDFHFTSHNVAKINLNKGIVTLIELYNWNEISKYFRMKVKVESVSHSLVSDSLQSHGLSMEFFRQEYWSGLPFPSPKYFRINRINGNDIDRTDNAFLKLNFHLQHRLLLFSC